MYYCRVEKDSISQLGSRLTTFVVTSPRVILAETVTHRRNSDSWGYEETEVEVSWSERTTTPDISKNSASSRAIPVKRMIDAVMNDPYVPERWSKAGPGMQAAGYLEPGSYDAELATATWLEARDEAVKKARDLLELGVHKQDVNRLLEPWCWVTQVVTSSCWDNFFALRCDRMAHPAIQKIARMMYLARRASTLRNLIPGQWHLPFVKDEDTSDFFWLPTGRNPEISDIPDLIKFSAARCAWVSYANHDKDGTSEQMLRTFDRLVGSTPLHSSPVEHQATPLTSHRDQPELRSNLEGWLQARKLLRQERVDRYEPSEDEIASWGDV